ncbi:MAG TPA: hypothetical protein DCR32_01115 [Opitutae bacterium]|jgi:O-antigen/teichoic acid export membrane protein|nr:hypothetical protein [Opitutae bacterium]
MTPSQRIALNTAVTYGRSIVAMALGLLGSRWIFGSLGEVDYGLMAVVSALIATVYFINMGISSTSARYFAFSIGEGTSEQTNRWFNAALCLHVILVPVLILVVWLLGEWALRDFLNIPEARLTTALWVFRISLLSAFCGLALSPFIDMFIAKQNILEVSLWALLTSLVNFGLAFTLLYYSGDRWLFITVGMASFAIIALCAQAIRATMLYDECRIRFRLWLDFVRIWELCKFSGWGVFGAMGELCRGQGLAVLLNHRFTPMHYPQVNASFTVGLSLSSYTQSLSHALLQAFTPEITATEGRGERSKMLQHANRVSKYGTFLTLLFAIPLILEIDYVLELWLVEPPQLAGAMTRLILIAFIIERCTTGQTAAVNAKGKIAGYHITIGTSMLLTLPIAWLLLAAGFEAIAVCWAYLLTVLLCLLGKLYWAKRLVGLSPIGWLREVLLPCSVVMICGLVAGAFVRQCFLEASLFRLGSVIIMSLASCSIIGWVYLISSTERAVLKSYLARCMRMKKCIR